MISRSKAGGIASAEQAGKNNSRPRERLDLSKWKSNPLADERRAARGPASINQLIFASSIRRD